MYGIPNMKLEKSILDMRIEIMEKEGIVFHTDTDIGAPHSLSLEDLINDNDSVLLTTGATKPRDLPIPGREGDGVHFAMEFLGKNTKSLLDSKLKNKKFILLNIFLTLYIGINLIGGERGLVSYFEKKKMYEGLIQKEQVLSEELKHLKHKIRLITSNDLDYLDMLYREKLKYGTKDEILIKLK